MNPYLIGIAGPSCSGKTELARKWATALSGAPILSLDSYYHALDHLSLEERATCNFDHPDALDWLLIVQHVRELAQAHPVEEPVYLFDKHTRSTQSRRVVPGDFVILEGLFTLHHPEVRNLLKASVFVKTSDEECYRRRLVRDIAERGRTEECVRKQYESTVRPMAEAFVLPTSMHAHITIAGDQPLEDALVILKDFVLPSRRLAASA